MKKRLTAVIITAVILALSLLPMVSAGNVLKGDVSGNGKVEAGDARLALRCSVGLEQLTTLQMKVADMDSNGKLTAADARIILRTSVGLEELSYMENEEETQPEKEETTREEEESTTEKEEEIFSEIILIDNSLCLIKITGIDKNADKGYTLKTEIRNKSDKKYTFSAEDVSINGVMCRTDFSEQVTDGKTVKTEIVFNDELLKKNGIGEYTHIEMTFCAYDGTGKDELHETVHVYPLGKDKAQKHVRNYRPTDSVIVDNEDITVIVTDYNKDGNLGYSVNLFILNKTDKKITAAVNEAYVNDKVSEPSFEENVTAGKCSFSRVTWTDKMLSELGITQVREIEFLLTAYCSDTSQDDNIVSRWLELKPQKPTVSP